MKAIEGKRTSEVLPCRLFHSLSWTGRADLNSFETRGTHGAKMIAERSNHRHTTSEAGANPPALQFPFLDLKLQFENMRGEIMAAIERVMESQQFILGPEGERLEEEFARKVECRHAIGCASGSDALLLSLMALEVGPGDEVITTPFTFVATAGAIALVGAQPVFVDIEPGTYNMDPAKMEEAITPRTRGIIPVHLFGLPAKMDQILEVAASRHLFVVEDAAQSIGARYQGRAVGGLGDIGCFSFFPSKNLGAAGDGGMITTNDPDLAGRIRILRVHGSRKKYFYDLIGRNSRLDELQAAILRIKLRYLDEWTAARQRNAERYRLMLEDRGLGGSIIWPEAPSDSVHVYNQFEICAEDRDALRDHLRQSGIPTEIYYPLPLHLQGAFSSLGHKTGDFPEAEMASGQVLALPIYPELREENLRATVGAITKFYAGKIASQEISS